MERHGRAPLLSCNSVQVRPASHFSKTPLTKVISTGGLKSASAEVTSQFMNIVQDTPDQVDEFLNCFNPVECLQLVNTRLQEESFHGLYSYGTPLAYAIVNDNSALVDSLLKFGADANIRPCVMKPTTCQEMPAICNHLHFSLLVYASPGIVQRLLEFGDLPNSTHFAVHEYAAKCAHKKLVSLLLNDIDVNIVGDFNRTALHLAIAADNADMVNILLNKEADVNQVDKQGKSPLVYAVEKRSKLVAKQLLAHGSNVNKTDSQGRSALHFAVKALDIQMVRLLLSKGADVTVKSLSGLTPIDQVYTSSSAKGNRAQPSPDQFPETKAKIAALLLRDPNASLVLNETQFVNIAFLLVRYGSADSVLHKLLIQNKPHLQMKDELGQSLLHAAATGGRTLTVKELIQQGLDVKEQDLIFWQPMHYAAMSCQLECLNLLVNAGADINSVTPCGWSAIWLLLRHGHREVALELIRRGCDTRLTMTLSALRQAISSIPLPLSLFNPKEQKVAAVKHARQGRRKLTLSDFAREMGWEDVEQATATVAKSGGENSDSSSGVVSQDSDGAASDSN